MTEFLGMGDIDEAEGQIEEQSAHAAHLSPARGDRAGQRLSEGYHLL